MSIEEKPHYLIFKALRNSLRTYLKSRSSITVERNDTLGMKPPYIILANHVTNWDPLLINSFINEPICFVAGEPLFRHPLLRKVLHYVGAIPKTKFKNDTRTIKGIIKAKKHNRVIGLFPEGNRNWDGTTEPLTFATAKLVKSLNIPVVVATISGGYLSQPRWAESYREGKISLSFIKLCNVDELRNESPEAIHHMLTKALHHDDLKWQSTRLFQYKGKSLAHYLERLLFICPNCMVPDQLRSNDDLFECQNCHYTVRYTPLGTFEEVNHPLRFSTTRDWNRWQLDYVEKSLLNPSWHTQWNDVMKDPVKLFISADNKPFTHHLTGTITLGERSITLHTDNKQPLHFSFDELDGLNIHLHNRLDFFIDKKLYRVGFYQPRTSAYKWLKLIQTVQALAKDSKGE